VVTGAFCECKVMVTMQESHVIKKVIQKYCFIIHQLNQLKHLTNLLISG
jgi:hypothetical protein